MIAVLMTCFNRKEKTLCCIESLFAQENMPTFDLYVCDDASTDGTSEAILEMIRLLYFY
jgi:glycosyltransferase involved in cell wall biosynthesis